MFGSWRGYRNEIAVIIRFYCLSVCRFGIPIHIDIVQVAIWNVEVHSVTCHPCPWLRPAHLSVCRNADMIVRSAISMGLLTSYPLVHCHSGLRRLVERVWPQSTLLVIRTTSYSLFAAFSNTRHHLLLNKTSLIIYLPYTNVVPLVEPQTFFFGPMNKKRSETGQEYRQSLIEPYLPGPS